MFFCITAKKISCIITFMDSEDKIIEDDVWGGSDDELENKQRDKDWNKLEDRFMDVSQILLPRRPTECAIGRIQRGDKLREGSPSPTGL